MAATYSPDLSRQLDQARFIFRDYNGYIEQGSTPYAVSRPLVQDEEYLGAIAVWGEDEGLAKVAENLASNFAQKVISYANSQEGTSVRWPDRPSFYLELAASIRENGFSTTTTNAKLATGAPALPSYEPTLVNGAFQPADERLAHL